MKARVRCPKCTKTCVIAGVRKADPEARLRHFHCGPCGSPLELAEFIAPKPRAQPASTETDAFLRPWLPRFWQLAACRNSRTATLGQVDATVPPLKITSRSTSEQSSGLCRFVQPISRLPLISLEVTVGIDPVDAIATLLHEVVHASLPRQVKHGDAFWRLFAAAAEEAFGIPKIPVYQYLCGNNGTKHCAITEAIRPIIQPCASGQGKP